MAGRLANENMILFNFFLKFSSEQILQYLACLNENIACESCSYSVEVSFLYSNFYYIAYLSAFFFEAIYFRSIPTTKYYPKGLQLWIFVDVIHNLFKSLIPQ